MNLKQRVVSIVIGCVLTVACYVAISPSVGILNRQNAIAQEDAARPTLEEIQADLIGRRIEVERNWKWYDIYSVENFAVFNVNQTSHYEYVTEYIVSAELNYTERGKALRVAVVLHVTYRKTDPGWKLVAVKNLRIR